MRLSKPSPVLQSRLLAGALGGLASLWSGWVTAATDPARFERFETSIRPVLVEHCYPCHSAEAKDLKGSLRLDTREWVLKGGASGPLIVPGKPEESLLVKVLHGTAPDLGVMPPKKAGGPLRPEQIAAITDWIRDGAPDPRTGETTQTGPVDGHWAFQPPRSVPAPAMAGFEHLSHPIDRYIVAQLASKGLAPAARANRHTLLRRAAFDLTGLPPTPEAMQAFLTDPSPKAFESAVDRLLASPRYGERWGRHWLDIARYADSKGYVFEQERRFSHSFTYRDWVVQALNQDLPYDQFLIQQIAGDQVATTDNPWPMAAQGFLTLGRRFLDNPHDIIDDRIDVVTRGTLGLTVGCARCHDHKYDPIPAADYYSLYGIFNSSQEPDEKPLLGPNPNPTQAAAYAKEKADREKELAEFRAERTRDIAKKLRDRVGDYLLAAQDSMALDWTNLEGLARVRSLDPGLVGAWKGRLEHWQGDGDAVFGPWFALARLGTNDFAAHAKALLESPPQHAGTNAAWNTRVIQALRNPMPNAFGDVAKRYGELLVEADRAWSDALDLARTQGRPAPESLPDPDQERLRLVLTAPDSPVMAAMKDIDRFFDTPTGQKIRALKRKVDELEATHPGAPLRAMAYLDRPQPIEPVVFKRGNPGNPGAKVPRQFLGILSGTNRPAFAKGSGRLELARAIANRDNPLTARVLVNRVWMWHFGAPLVHTPSDFGVRGEKPTHPELLDHLAVWFMDHGWSLKALHRYILLSDTYQQRSDPEGPGDRTGFEKGELLDPGNTLLWRMNRQRLDFEALRDSLLWVSGKLDGDIGGQPVPMFEETATPRRTLYGFIDRQNLPGLLRAFDFASPDTTAPLRFQTTTPQQALFLMNSAFLADRARDFTGRADVLSLAKPADRIRRLYQLAYQRDPSTEEIRLGLDFVSRPAAAQPEPPPTAAWRYGTGGFNPATGKVEGWRPLPHFTGKAWQWDAKLPSADGLWTMLDAKGGHPGSGAQNAAIRRWTSPIQGVVRIEGTLEHPAQEGDGVVGRVVSSRRGQLAKWDVAHGKTVTELGWVAVEPGETLDFVVEPGSNENSDSFRWSPSIERLDPPSDRASAWKAGRDFAGPQTSQTPLDAWQRYAQVLLSANEFVFVD